MSIPRTTLPLLTGEAIRIGLQLVASDGTFETLTGRVFAWALTDAAGAVVDTATASISTYDGHSTAIMTFAGSDTAGLLTSEGEARRLNGRVLEVTSSGSRRHCDVDLNVGRGVASADLPSAGSGGVAIHLITLDSE